MEGSAGKLFTQVNRMNRAHCTDHPCLMLFFVLWLIMFVTTYFSVAYGNYLAIINGYDSFGNTCGIKDNKPFFDFILSGTDTSDKPYLLFMGYTNLSHVVKVCVEKCISEVMLEPKFLYDEHERTNSHLCRYDFKMKLLHFSIMKEFNDALGPCPDIPCEESFPVKHRCIPLDTSRWRFLESYSFLSIGSSPFAAFFTHVYQAWPYMFGLISFAFVISAALLCVMRWKAKSVVSVLFFLAILSTLAVCIIEWIIILRMPPVKGDMFFDFREEEGRILYNFLQDFKINKIVIITMAVLSLLLAESLLIILVLAREDIPRVAVLCEEAVKCWKQLPSLTGVALTTLLAMLLFFSYWTYIMLCATTASAKKLSPLGDRADYTDDPKIKLRLFHQIEYIEVGWLRMCCWIYILGFVWVTEFICACQRFWLEMLVTKWYFKNAADWSLFKEHMGSVARGSFIGLLLIPRLLLAFLCKLLENWRAGASFQVGLKTIENQLQLFPGVYAVVGIRNVGLYPAIQTANAIIGPDINRVKDVSNSVHFIFLSAQLFIANCTCLLGVLLLNNVDDLFFYTAPVLLMTVYAFYIARILLSTIEVTLNTLFLCVHEDKQINQSRGRWSQGNFIEFCIGRQLD